MAKREWKPAMGSYMQYLCQLVWEDGKTDGTYWESNDGKTRKRVKDTAEGRASPYFDMYVGKTVEQHRREWLELRGITQEAGK